MIDQDEAARSVREGVKETEREQEKLGFRGRRKAGPRIVRVRIRVKSLWQGTGASGGLGGGG